MLKRSLKMASKDIASFFTKPTTPAKRAVGASLSTKDEVKQPASSPLSTTSSGKKSGLSEAMRKAIAEGAEEGQRDAKRAKIETSSTLLHQALLMIEPKTASLFTKTAVAAAVPAKLDIPTARTKDELIESLSKYPGKKELLQLELDTLGEDWLLALQNEFTKPYFVAVSLSSHIRLLSVMRMDREVIESQRVIPG
jgi:uracil-DNA glycosylase